MFTLDFVRRSCLIIGLTASAFASAEYHTTAPPADVDNTPPMASPAATAWAQRRIDAGVVYFLDNAAPRIRRYRLDNSTWLSDIPLSAIAGDFDVDGTGLYVAFADHVERYSLDGTTHNTLVTLEAPSPLFEVAGDLLILQQSSYVKSYAKATGTFIHEAYSYLIVGSSPIETESRIFGRSLSISPSDIMMVKYDAASGAITSISDSPYHGALPNATRTYAREAGDLVIDDSGTVYASNDLHHLGNLGGSIQGCAFLQDRFAVMQGSSIHVFSNDLHDLGEIPAPVGLLDIFSVGTTVYSVTGAIGALVIAPLDVLQAQPATPPSARDWNTTAIKADFVLGTASNLILVSKIEHAAYSFDAASWAFQQTTPMFLNPLLAAYSPVTHRLYASYNGGSLYTFPMSNPGSASRLSATPYTQHGLATAGEFILAADPSGAWSSHYTFNPDGTPLSNVEWNYYSRHYEWDPNQRRLYFFRDDQSPNDLHWEQIGTDGRIVAEGESPYHGDVSATPPIRVSPDGARLIIGSGQVFETGTLTFAGNIPEPLADIAWSNSDTFAVTANASPMLKRYNAAYSVVSSGRVRGTPRRLLSMDSGFLYVADVGASTIIGVLDAYVSKADLAVDPLPPGSLFNNGSVVNLQFRVGNNGTVPANNATVVSNLSGLDNVTWQCVREGWITAGCSDAGQGSISRVLSLADGGQARFDVIGQIPANARNEVEIRFQINPAVASSDPELRNNSQTYRLKLDRLFDNGFEQARLVE